MRHYLSDLGLNNNNNNNNFTINGKFLINTHATLSFRSWLK